MDLLPPQDRAKERLRRLITTSLRRTYGRTSGRIASLVVALNEDTGNSLRRWNSHVIVEPNAALPAAKMRNHTWDRSARLVFAGRLVGWKGPLTALRVLEQLPDHYTLEIFGDGPARSQVEQLRSKLGLDARVRLHGSIPRDDLQRELTNCRALILPSLHDSGPWVVAEALMMGCPVVAPDLAGAGEFARLAGQRPVVAQTSDELVKGLAALVLSVRAPADVDRYDRSRLPCLLADWMHMVLTTHEEDIA